MEIWKDVKGYEGIYMVSSCGKIKTLKRTIYRKDGRIHYVQPEKELKPSLFKTGYYYVSLHKNTKIKVKTIHSLVAEAFIENTNNKRTINHKDGNKLNNDVSNLEWNTDKENLEHAINNNLKKRKEIIAYNDLVYIHFKNSREVENMGFKVKTVREAIRNKRKHKGYNWNYINKQERLDKLIK